MSGLKVKVSGAEFNQGISKAGQDFAFAVVTYLVPKESRTTAKATFQQCGYEEKSMDMVFDFNVYKEFAAVSNKFPCELELQLVPNPKNPERNVVGGFKVV